MANQAVIKNVSVKVGDIIQVSQKILEGNKERSQVFEGIVISIKGHGGGKSFTVRKIATGGVGVERIWPVNSPWIQKVQVVRHGKVRRAKLYFLRKRVGREAIKVKEKLREVITQKQTVATKKIKKPTKKVKANVIKKEKPRHLRRATGKKATPK